MGFRGVSALFLSASVRLVQPFGGVIGVVAYDLTNIISVIISIYNRENINLHHFRCTKFQDFFVRIYQNFCSGVVDPTECERLFGFSGVQFLGRESEERTGQGLRASARGVGRADEVGEGLGGITGGLEGGGASPPNFS